MFESNNVKLDSHYESLYVYITPRANTELIALLEVTHAPNLAMWSVYDIGMYGVGYIRCRDKVGRYLQTLQTRGVGLVVLP